MRLAAARKPTSPTVSAGFHTGRYRGKLIRGRNNHGSCRGHEGLMLRIPSHVRRAVRITLLFVSSAGYSVGQAAARVEQDKSEMVLKQWIL